MRGSIDQSEAGRGREDQSEAGTMWPGEDYVSSNIGVTGDERRRHWRGDHTLTEDEQEITLWLRMIRRPHCYWRWARDHTVTEDEQEEITLGLRMSKRRTHCDWRWARYHTGTEDEQGAPWVWIWSCMARVQFNRNVKLEGELYFEAIIFYFNQLSVAAALRSSRG